MAITATVRISYAIAGALAGARTHGPEPASFADSVGTIDRVDLSSGANTITVPTGATAVLVLPPSDNTETITLKGVTGDTGVPLARASWSFLNLRDDSPPTDFVLTAGGAIAGVELVWF